MQPPTGRSYQLMERGTCHIVQIARTGFVLRPHSKRNPYLSRYEAMAYDEEKFGFVWQLLGLLGSLGSRRNLKPAGARTPERLESSNDARQ
jgi:hypothetical protein